MPTPVAKPISLSDDDRSTLEAWVQRRRTAQAVALRARIVLACAAGANNQEVARRLGIDRNTVRKWRARFAEAGTAGLVDQPCPGDPAPDRRCGHRTVAGTHTRNGA